ncbi:hypothetical protein [Nocardia sp. NPDC055049]
MAATPEMAALIAADDDLLDRTVLVDGWPHEAPDQPFTVEGAQQAWQGHMSCSLEVCARKRAAARTLVDAKRLILDERAARFLR